MSLEISFEKLEWFDTDHAIVTLSAKDPDNRDFYESKKVDIRSDTSVGMQQEMGKAWEIYRNEMKEIYNEG